MGIRPKKKGKPSAPSTGAVEFLVVLPAEQIKSLKILALEQGRNVTASSLLAKALSAWLKRNRSASAAPFQSSAGEDKRQFLSKLDSELVREVKGLAIDWKLTASSIVGQAVSDWLRAHDRRK